MQDKEKRVKGREGDTDEGRKGKRWREWWRYVDTGEGVWSRGEQGQGGGKITAGFISDIFLTERALCVCVCARMQTYNMLVSAQGLTHLSLPLN